MGLVEVLLIVICVNGVIRNIIEYKAFKKANNTLNKTKSALKKFVESI